MQLAFIVSTIGRPDEMSTLLNTIGPYLKHGDIVSVSIQGRYEETTKLLDEAAKRGLPVISAKSPLGVSIGRNTAVANLQSRLKPEDDPLLLFPNDTSVIVPAVIERLRELPPDFSFGGMRLEAEGSTLSAWPGPESALNKRTVWAAIEPGFLIRRNLFLKAGGFDTSLGTGAATPWQSGEGTDLLLRIAKSHPQLRFSWLPEDSAWVCSPETAAGLDLVARRRKLRAYARGYGMILRKHNYPLTFKLRSILGAILAPLRHQARTVSDARSILIGRLEGLFGRTVSFSSQPVKAVEH